MFPELDLHHTDPAQHVVTTGNLDRYLSDVWKPLRKTELYHVTRHMPMLCTVPCSNKLVILRLGTRFQYP